MAVLIPSSLKNPSLLSQLSSRNHGEFAGGALPGSGSVPFFCRAKVPRSLPRGQPGATEPWAKATHGCLALIQAQPAATKHNPHTAGVNEHQKHRRKPQLSPNFGWEQKQSEEQDPGSTAG